MNTQFKLSSILLAMSFAFSANLMAKTVFDPSNFKKNTITAVQQVKQTAIQLAIKEEEVKQYLAMLENLKTANPAVINDGVSRGILPPSDATATVKQAISSAQGVYSSYKAAGTVMDGLIGVYKQFDTVNNALIRLSADSKVPVTKILAYEAEQAAKGRDLANNEFIRLTELNKSLESHQRRADAIAINIPKASGALQMLQLVGVQNHLISDQLSHMVQTTSSSAQASSNEAYLKAAEREKSALIAKQAEERNDKLYKRAE